MHTYNWYHSDITGIHYVHECITVYYRAIPLLSFFSFIFLFIFYILYGLQRSLLQYIMLQITVTDRRNYNSSFRIEDQLNDILFLALRTHYSIKTQRYVIDYS
jgi:hypothetical protein